jgi:hypothetical protein
LKSLLYLFFSIFFIQNCASTIEPSFDKSNQVFLEKTIDELNLSKDMDKKLDKDSSIAIVSIENNLTKDTPLTALIEDYMIDDLVNNGFTVFDRDLDALINIVRESKNEHYSLSHEQWEYGIQSPLYDTWPDINDTVSEMPYDIPQHGLQLYETQLESAEYILSYRVLEFGLMYTPIIDNTSIPKEKREGIVRINYRIQNTTSGQVVHSGTLNAQLEDEIRKNQKRELANYHYSFFGYEYPNQKPWQLKGVWDEIQGGYRIENHSSWNDNRLKTKSLSQASNISFGVITGLGFGGASEGDPLFGVYLGRESDIGKVKVNFFGNAYLLNLSLDFEKEFNGYHGIIGIGNSGVEHHNVMNDYYYDYIDYDYVESTSLNFGLGKNIIMGRLSLQINGQLNWAIDNDAATFSMIKISLGK